jgi:hypothetical protein
MSYSTVKSGLRVRETYGNHNVWSIHSPPQYIVCSDYGDSCDKSLNTLYPPIRFGVVPGDSFSISRPPTSRCRH